VLLNWGVPGLVAPVLRVSALFLPVINRYRVATCLQNLEMSGSLTAVMEMPENWPKVREMWGNLAWENCPLVTGSSSLGLYQCSVGFCVALLEGFLLLSHFDHFCSDIYSINWRKCMLEVGITACIRMPQIYNKVGEFHSVLRVVTLVILPVICWQLLVISDVGCGWAVVTSVGLDIVFVAFLLVLLCISIASRTSPHTGFPLYSTGMVGKVSS